MENQILDGCRGQIALRERPRRDQRPIWRRLRAPERIGAPRGRLGTGRERRGGMHRRDDRELDLALRERARGIVQRRHRWRGWSGAGRPAQRAEGDRRLTPAIHAEHCVNLRVGVAQHQGVLRRVVVRECGGGVTICGGHDIVYPRSSWSSAWPPATAPLRQDAPTAAIVSRGHVTRPRGRSGIVRGTQAERPVPHTSWAMI